MQTNHSGFTLIELLVVVLIIGILASVALPQYTKAVNKSRLATHWPVLKTLSDAASVCYLAKGSFCDIDELDIAVPECKNGNSTTNGSCAYRLNGKVARADNVGNDGTSSLGYYNGIRLCGGPACKDLGFNRSAASLSGVFNLATNSTSEFYYFIEYAE